VHPPARLVKLIAEYGRKRGRKEEDAGRKTGRGHQGKYCDLDIHQGGWTVCFLVGLVFVSVGVE